MLSEEEIREEDELKDINYSRKKFKRYQTSILAKCSGCGAEIQIGEDCIGIKRENRILKFCSNCLPYLESKCFYCSGKCGWFESCTKILGEFIIKCKNENLYDISTQTIFYQKIIDRIISLYENKHFTGYQQYSAEAVINQFYENAYLDNKHFKMAIKLFMHSDKEFKDFLREKIDKKMLQEFLSKF